MVGFRDCLVDHAPDPVPGARGRQMQDVRQRRDEPIEGPQVAAEKSAYGNRACHLDRECGARLEDATVIGDWQGLGSVACGKDPLGR